MPNIPEFNAPSLDIRSSEIGVESVAAAGRRLGAYGSQIAETKRQLGSEIAGTVKSVGDQSVQYLEHREINTGAMHGADIVAKANQSWNAFITGADIPQNDPDRQDKINARVQNPNAAQQWREQTLEPMLEQFQSGFITQGGQQWAERFAAAYRNHATEKALADQSSMAGSVVQANLEKTVNALSVASFNDPSGHSLDFNVGLLKSTIQDTLNSSPTITPALKARLSTELQKSEENLVKAAIQGRILKGAPYSDITSDPKYAPYIKPAENTAFERQEKFYQKSTEVATRQAAILEKQQAEQAVHSQVNDSFARNVSVDPQTGNVTINPKFVQEMTRLPFKNQKAPDAANIAKTWIDWAESQQKPPPRSDNPQSVGDLLNIASDTTKTLDDVKIAVAKADIAKTITPETRAQINQVATDIRNINDPFLKNAMKVAEEQLSPKITGVPVDTSKYAAFYYDFIHNQYLPAKAAGTLPPNALDINDKTSLISQAITKATGGPQATVPAAIGANGGLTAPAPAAPKAPPPPPQPNEIRNGYQFMGGNPADPKSWKPAS